MKKGEGGAIGTLVPGVWVTAVDNLVTQGKKGTSGSRGDGRARTKT